LGATLRSLLSARKIRGGLPRLVRGALSAALLLAAWPAAAERPPVTLALVIDTSGSLARPDLDLARELTIGVLAALPAGSEAAVFSFDDQSRVVLPRTSDPEAVRSAVDGLKGAGRYTALYDALYDASRYLRDAPGRRRAILLVTDGRDERSAVVLEDGLAVAREDGIPVFCVGVGRVEERALRRIAKLTEGRYRLGFETDPAVLAREILEAPEVPAPAPTPDAVASPAPSAPPPTVPEPAPPAPAVSPLVWTGAGLLLLAVSGGLLLLATRRRSGTSGTRAASPGPVGRPPDGGSPPTVFSRLDDSREALERTMLLREKPVLVVTAGKHLGSVFPLSRGSSLSVGRARANDIALDDVAVSSQHCRIRPEGDRFAVHDLESTNGTRVNDRRVTKHLLEEGDVIQVGETRLEFRIESTATEGT
jgi:hypothetical protein